MLKIAISMIAASLALNCSRARVIPHPHGVAILSGREAQLTLRQCSRATPAIGEASWTPDSVSIAALEQTLPVLLRAQHPDVNWSKFPTAWARRYLGIVRGGRRYLYGDYSPDGVGDVCDGGPIFFGAEYDVTSHKITHLAFNGPA